ncbi:hypothetical protein D3C76_1210200 [compost metagenome]
MPQACFLIQQFSLVREVKRGNYCRVFECARVQFFKLVCRTFEPDNAGDLSLEPYCAAKPESWLGIG